MSETQLLKGRDWRTEFCFIFPKDPSVYCLPEIHLRCENTKGLKVKGWSKIFHANSNQMIVRQCPL